jgi:hypothetical protein
MILVSVGTQMEDWGRMAYQSSQRKTPHGLNISRNVVLVATTDGCEICCEAVSTFLFTFLFEITIVS